MSRNRLVPIILPEDAKYVRGLVVHEDNNIIAFDKPAGLAVQTRGNRGPCLENLLPAFAKSNGKIPRLVHRLDTGTSGILVAAKTKPMAAHLSEQFAKRLAKKTYLALVGGRVPVKRSGTINQQLLKCLGERGVPPMVPSQDENAQAASTHWRIASKASDKALFELRPLTGRMHQLRAHMKHLGCPILGDKLYGDKNSAPRLMLHASRLRLTLPDEEVLDLYSPMPVEMREHATILGLAVPEKDA